jgi:hypothetical protein
MGTVAFDDATLANALTDGWAAPYRGGQAAGPSSSGSIRAHLYLFDIAGTRVVGV